jgi:hypothetical protein
MIYLSLEHPETEEYLRNGGFSVQMPTSNPFGQISVDQTVEETINKDTQTPDGSFKPMAVQKFYIAAEY